MVENLLKDRILERKEIEELIPHRGLWFRLDKIVEIRENSITAIKIYTVEECDGHFPKNPVVPGVLILESLAQAGLALVSYHQKALGGDKLPVLGHADVKFYSLVKPGDKLVLEMELVNSKEEACLLEGRAFVDSRRVAKCVKLTGVYIDKPK
jgi:3-hydroxymyristoyl/3-hydroxydecanoyl-(acyl carrier protein) dehydratase